MTSVNDLNDGVLGKKPWLNPLCNSIKASTILGVKNVTILSLEAGNVFATGGGTLTLLPSQMVNAVFGFIATTIVNLPSATAVQSFIGTLPSEITFYYFSFKVYVRSGVSVTFNVDSSMQTFDNLQSFIYSNATISNVFHDVIFAFTSLGWKVFY